MGSSVKKISNAKLRDGSRPIVSAEEYAKIQEQANNNFAAKFLANNVDVQQAAQAAQTTTPATAPAPTYDPLATPEKFLSALEKSSGGNKGQQAKMLSDYVTGYQGQGISNLLPYEVLMRYSQSRPDSTISDFYNLNETDIRNIPIFANGGIVSLL